MTMSDIDVVPTSKQRQKHVRFKAESTTFLDIVSTLGNDVIQTSRRRNNVKNTMDLKVGSKSGVNVVSSRESTST